MITQASAEIYGAIDSGDLASITSILESHPSLLLDENWAEGGRRNGNYSPLGFALIKIRSQNGHRITDQTVEILLRYGADPNRSDLGNTSYRPVVLASIAGSHESVLRLINAGATLDGPASESFSLCGAVIRDYERILQTVSVLYDNRVDINSPHKKSGNTILHHLVSQLLKDGGFGSDIESILELSNHLIKLGADPLQTNNAGLSPSDLAKKISDPPLRRHLLAAFEASYLHSVARSNSEHQDALGL